MIHKAFNVVDKRTTAYNVAKYDPTVQLKVSVPLTKFNFALM